MALSIYGIVQSRAIRPLWAATELGLAFEHVAQPYQGGATRVPGFLSLNPNGHIPVLVDTGDGRGDPVVVWESMACVLYLAHHHAPADGHGLRPQGAAEDAEALRWSFWVVNAVEADALSLLMHRLVMPPERRKPALADAAEARLARVLPVLEGHLTRQRARGWAHVAAPRFTAADLCLASVLSWLRPAPALVAAHPLMADWLRQCLARPAHRQARALG